MADNDDKKERMVSARLTEHERELVQADARKRGMNVSDYLRAAILQQREEATKTRLAEIETRLAEQDQTIFQLVTAITDLRVAMARGVRALLIANEPDEDRRESIRRWIRTNMLPEEEDPESSGGAV
jgi:uncharacterized coiled-coil protein SlyX